MKALWFSTFNAPGPSIKRFSKYAPGLVKLCITVALVYWLLASDTLRLEKLAVLLATPKMLIVSLLTWFCMPVILATTRWRILLAAVHIRLSFLRACALQVAGLFINSIVPGNVGGDLLKNQAVFGRRGSSLVVLVLVERIVGLVSLLWAGGLGLLLSFDRVVKDAQLRTLGGVLLFLIVGSIIVPLIALRLFNHSRHSSSEANFPRRSLRGKVGELLASMNDVIFLILREKKTISKALAVSFVMHLGNISYFLFVSRQLGNVDATFAQVAMVFPLGLLTIALPISVAGVGVGHLAFEKLFSLIGLSAGADVFNLFLVAQLAPSLIGTIPSLLMMRGWSLRGGGLDLSAGESSEMTDGAPPSLDAAELSRRELRGD